MGTFRYADERHVTSVFEDPPRYISAVQSVIQICSSFDLQIRPSFGLQRHQNNILGILGNSNRINFKLK